MVDDLELFGMTLSEPDTEDDGSLDVDEDNWLAVMVFSRCATQWNYAGMGGVIGMNYPGVQIVLNLTVKRKEHAEIFDAIQVMERAALKVLNETAKKESAHLSR